MARDKGSTLVVAGGAFAEENESHKAEKTETSYYEVDSDDKNNESSDEEKEQSDTLLNTLVASVPLHDSKPRLSRAERRRLRRDPNAVPTNRSRCEEKRKKNMRGNDFRDGTYFIENDAVSNPEEAHRQRQVEAAMQPSAATSVKGIVGNALRLEEAMLDVVGDENEQLVQKQRMMRWDKSKRKYIQTTVGAELSGQSKSKRIKLESGQVVKSDKLKLGEIYEKWQKKTNRSVGRDGVFDNPAGEMDPDAALGRYKGGKKRNGKGKQGGDSDGVVSAKHIKMKRERQQDMKLKNMKKSDRRRLERSNKKDQSTPKAPSKKGFQGKKGASGRWKK
jgi:hypothetical protein